MKNILSYLRRGISYIRHGIPQYTIVNQIAVVGESKQLQNRIALITGGGSGIGKAIALSFLKSGATVVITGRNTEKLKSVYDEWSELYADRIFYAKLDVANCDSLEDSFASINLMLKGRTIDLLVNNAGIEGGHISHCNENDFESILNTNLKGVFFLSKLVAEKMIAEKIKGNILNIASSSSLRPAVSAYMISKWGVRGLTLGLAKMYIKYGIVVNGIAPGPTATPMMLKDGEHNRLLTNNPSGRYAEPEEISNAAVFLTSDMGRMVVGDILYMTGGAGVITFDDVQY